MLLASLAYAAISIALGFGIWWAWRARQIAVGRLEQCQDSAATGTALLAIAPILQAALEHRDAPVRDGSGVSEAGLRSLVAELGDVLGWSAPTGSTSAAVLLDLVSRPTGVRVRLSLDGEVRHGGTFALAHSVVHALLDEATHAANVAGEPEVHIEVGADHLSIAYPVANHFQAAAARASLDRRVGQESGGIAQRARALGWSVMHDVTSRWARVTFRPDPQFSSRLPRSTPLAP